MVSQQTLRSQIDRAKQQASTAQKQLRKKQQQAEQFKAEILAPTPQTVLRSQTRKQSIVRKGKKAQALKQVGSEFGLIESQFKELEAFEKQISGAEKSLRAFGRSESRRRFKEKQRAKKRGELFRLSAIEQKFRLKDGQIRTTQEIAELERLAKSPDAIERARAIKELQSTRFESLPTEEIDVLAEEISKDPEITLEDSPTFRKKVTKTFGKIFEGLEKAEIALFPALVGAKFLESDLATQTLNVETTEKNRQEKERIRDLVNRSGTLDPRKALDKRKAALELNELIRKKDKEIKKDLKIAETANKDFNNAANKFDLLENDLKTKKINVSQAEIKRNEIIEDLTKKGFEVSQVNGTLELKHPVFNKLEAFEGSALKTLVRRAEKGKTPLRDKSLLVTFQILDKALEAEKIVLAFQLGGLGLTKAGLAVPTIKGTPRAKQVFEFVSKGAEASLLGSFGALSAAQVLEETGSPELAAGAGLGTLLGFKAPGQFGNKLAIRNQLKSELKIELNKLSADKRDAFEEYMRQTKVLENFEPSAKNIKLDNIQSIKDKNGQVAIRDWLKGNKDRVVVGGSVAQTSQVELQRVLGDMDLYVQKGLSPSAAANSLANDLKAAGVERVSTIRGQVTIEGAKAIEFHDIDRLLTNIRQVTPDFVNPRSYIIKTPEGILIQRVGLQAKRKLVAGFADPKRFATGKYKKDLRDFKIIADRLFNNAVKEVGAEKFIKSAKAQKFEKGLDIKVKSEFEKGLEKLGEQAKDIDLIGIKLPTEKLKKDIFLKTSALKPSGIKVGGAGPVKLKAPKVSVPSQKEVKKPSKIFPSQVGIKSPPSQLKVGKKVSVKPVTSQPVQKITKKVTPSIKFSKVRSIPSQPAIKPQSFRNLPSQLPAKDLGFKTVPFKKIKDEKIKGRPGGLRPRLGGRQTGIPKIPKKRRTGYIPEAKERGKWKRLSKPLKSEAQATNLYRFVVDHSTSRRGRVREVEGVKKFGKRFAPSTSPLKFRKFRFKKGKKIPLKPRTEIEKTKFAIDTRGEVKGLKIARILQERFGKKKKIIF